MRSALSGRGRLLSLGYSRGVGPGSARNVALTEDGACRLLPLEQPARLLLRLLDLRASGDDSVGPRPSAAAGSSTPAVGAACTSADPAASDASAAAAVVAPSPLPHAAAANSSTPPASITAGLSFDAAAMATA